MSRMPSFPTRALLALGFRSIHFTQEDLMRVHTTGERPEEDRIGVSNRGENSFL